jgi:hypothetical protein
MFFVFSLGVIFLIAAGWTTADQWRARAGRSPVATTRPVHAAQHWPALLHVIGAADFRVEPPVYTKNSDEKLPPQRSSRTSHLAARAAGGANEMTIRLAIRLFSESPTRCIVDRLRAIGFGGHRVAVALDGSRRRNAIGRYTFVNRRVTVAGNRRLIRRAGLGSDIRSHGRFGLGICRQGEQRAERESIAFHDFLASFVLPVR